MACRSAATADELFETTQSPTTPDEPVSPGDLDTPETDGELHETVSPSTQVTGRDLDAETEASVETADEQRSALEAGYETVQELDAKTDRLDIMKTVRVIGGAMIGISILVVVLNEVFALESINNSSGPFSGVISSLKSTGGAALGLLVIGLLVLGANRVMGFFGGGF